MQPAAKRPLTAAVARRSSEDASDGTHRSRASPGQVAAPERELTAAETRIRTVLEAQFQPTKLIVEDQSGGCGAKYAVLVVSEAFRGVPLVKQHRMARGRETT